MAKSETSKGKRARKQTEGDRDAAPPKETGGAAPPGLSRRLLRAAKKLRAEDVVPCPADVRAAVVAAERGVIGVFGEPGTRERKAQVAAMRDALPELPIKKVLELPDLGRALAFPDAALAGAGVEGLRDRLWTLLVRLHADLRVVGYYRFRDELDHHAPKLPATVTTLTVAAATRLIAAATPPNEAGERTSTNGTIVRGG